EAGYIGSVQQNPEIPEASEPVQHARASRESMGKVIGRGRRRGALLFGFRELAGQVVAPRSGELSLALGDFDLPVEPLDLLLKGRHVLFAQDEHLLERLDPGPNPLEIGAALALCRIRAGRVSKERRAEKK